MSKLNNILFKITKTLNLELIQRSENYCSKHHWYCINAKGNGRQWLAMQMYLEMMSL